MWLWRSVVMFLLVSSSYGAPTSLGPTSNEEAEILWKQGQSALQNSEFQDAANSLQRFVDRYPSKPGYLKAHLLLGKALFGLGKAQESLAPFKYFISATGTRIESIEARLAIG